MFMAYATQGQLKPRLILFWDGLIQAVAYLGRESCVCINTPKCCPRLAEAVKELLGMLCFQLYPRPSRPRDAHCSGRKMSFVYILQSGKWQIEIHVIKEMCGVPQIAGTSRRNHETDRC